MEHNLEIPKEINKVSDTVWEEFQHRTKGMLSQQGFTDKNLDEMDNGVFNQVTNVACLLEFKYSFCMPDGHWGFW